MDKVNISKANIIEYLLAIYHKVTQEQYHRSGYLQQAVFIIKSVILFIHYTEASLELESVSLKWLIIFYVYILSSRQK